MLLSPEALRQAVNVAADMAACYRQQHNPGSNPIRDVDLLLVTCGLYVGQIVEAQRAHHLKQADMAVWAATILAADGTFHIWYVGDLDEDWERFVVCKEAFHIVLDDEAARNMDLMAHLIEMAGISNPVTPLATLTRSAASELMAEVAAMEFLFPYRERVAEHARDNDDWSAIAKRFGVPKHYVELHMSPGWMEALRPYCGVNAPAR